MATGGGGYRAGTQGFRTPRHQYTLDTDESGVTMLSGEGSSESDSVEVLAIEERAKTPAIKEARLKVPAVEKTPQ